MKFFYFVWICCFSFFLNSQELYLRENLNKAVPGDYLVASICKNLTLFHVIQKEENGLKIEEISLPENRRPSDWQVWLDQKAPYYNQWVIYTIDLNNGKIKDYYSVSKQQQMDFSEADNFLSKLLNIKLTKMAPEERRKLGPPPTSGPDLRPLWQPPFFSNGKIVKKIEFDAWKTRWPKDQTDLSGKLIEVYLPKDSTLYPAYFPYWLKIYGNVGAARVRIIDSGTGLKFPLTTYL